MKAPYTTLHGCGNSFAIIELSTVPGNTLHIGKAICDPSVLDVDGVLFVELPQRSIPPRVVVHHVQPDGSVAEMSGNGARCAAQWASEKTHADTIIVDTPAGEHRATIHGTTVSLEFNQPSFDPADIPLTRKQPLINESLCGYTATAVNTGVPHAVCFVEDVGTINIESIAPSIQHHDIFPQGTNVTFAAPSADRYQQRTYERGVEGETQACGTGAIAIVTAAIRTNRLTDTQHEVTVSLPGGNLKVTPTSPPTLAGPIVESDSGTLSMDSLGGF